VASGQWPVNLEEVASGGRRVVSGMRTVASEIEETNTAVMQWASNRGEQVPRIRETGESTLSFGLDLGPHSRSWVRRRLSTIDVLE